MTPARTVTAFLTAFGQGDVATALSVVDESVRVNLYATGLRGAGKAELGQFLVDTATAFPDLRLTVRRTIEAGPVVTVELKFEGTQAADYLGAINQEKHLDVDQAWRFTVEGDRIAGVDAYWCQNQLYRRLAVKRLDQISLV
ncbi:nuclear transport factor 2 family protein [Streptomyces antnestii]|uniref:Nuclear transport factor 2 family protein n=2 Tax=Streptomyces antnestii TaxID=2494256 RepID=A0A3S2VKS8_9ACTN|nr:nuclear transport factor 2 family protein [Streptomyces sp. San01]